MSKTYITSRIRFHTLGLIIHILELQTAFKHNWVMRRHAVACRQTSLRYGLAET